MLVYDPPAFVQVLPSIELIASSMLIHVIKSPRT